MKIEETTTIVTETYQEYPYDTFTTTYYEKTPFLLRLIGAPKYRRVEEIRSNIHGTYKRYYY